MRENEELFRTANNRLRKQVEDAVPRGQLIPFLCECVDDLCMKRMEMTMAEYESVRAGEDTFAVAPGHAAPAGESVVQEEAAYHVVRKQAA
jgi:hypothetical protein